MTTAARLRLGTVQLGVPYGIANRGGMPTPREADAILATALEVGVRSLDTAAAYGESEERIGSFLKRHGARGRLAVSSKLPPLDRAHDTGPLDSVIAEAIEGSLRRLGLERIDEYLIHHARDLRRHGRRLVEALARQRDRGRIGRIGVSVYGPHEIRLALDHVEISVVQHPLNLLDRRLLTTGRLADLRGRGIAVHARSPFLQGLLRLRPAEIPERMAAARATVDRLHRFLAGWGVAPGDVALAFGASQPGVECVVAGAESADQVRENAAAMARPLPPGLGDALGARPGDTPLEVLDPTRWPAEAM